MKYLGWNIQRGGGKTESESKIESERDHAVRYRQQGSVSFLPCLDCQHSGLSHSSYHKGKTFERERVCVCECRLNHISATVCPNCPYSCVDVWMCVCECGHTFLHQCVCMRVRRWLALRRVSPSSSLALFLPQSEDRHIFCPLAAALPWITFGLHECNWGNPASPWKVSKTWSVRKAGMWECFILCLFYWNQFFSTQSSSGTNFGIHWGAGHFHDLPEFPWCNLTTLFVLCAKQKKLRA